MQQFEKQIGELGEELGKLVIPAVNPVLSKMTETIKSLTNEDIEPWKQWAALSLAVVTGGASLQWLNAEVAKIKKGPDAAEDPNLGFRAAMKAGFNSAPPATGTPRKVGPALPAAITPEILVTWRDFAQVIDEMNARQAQEVATAMQDLANTDWSQFNEQAEPLVDNYRKMREEMLLTGTAAMQMSMMMTDGIASAIAGQQSFAQALSGIANSVVNEFQRIALAAIVAKATKDGVFKPGIGTFAAIAAATAGFAAIKGLFAKIGGSGGGGFGMGASGGFREGGTRYEQLGQRIQLVGSVEVTGTQLNILLNNQARVNKRTLAG
jgi:hypothetical protein